MQKRSKKKNQSIFRYKSSIIHFHKFNNSLSINTLSSREEKDWDSIIHHLAHCILFNHYIFAYLFHFIRDDNSSNSWKKIFMIGKSIRIRLYFCKVNGKTLYSLLTGSQEFVNRKLTSCRQALNFLLTENALLVIF